MQNENITASGILEELKANLFENETKRKNKTN